FWIDRYEYGVTAKGTVSSQLSDVSLKRIVAKGQGNPASASTGVGILFEYCDNGSITGCAVLNAGYCGVRLTYSDLNYITYCSVYGDSTSGYDSPDYYFDLVVSNGNSLYECTAERTAASSVYGQWGHGFAIPSKRALVQRIARTMSCRHVIP
ncbi:hypothetical protein ACFL2H_13200, partial [Planctomycetota bacterium]